MVRQPIPTPRHTAYRHGMKTIADLARIQNNLDLARAALKRDDDTGARLVSACGPKG
jgi:glycine betaine/choline ABC-type transport system substrate-binding protein